MRSLKSFVRRLLPTRWRKDLRQRKQSAEPSRLSPYQRSYLPFVDPLGVKPVGYRSIHPDPKKLRVLIIDSDEDIAMSEKIILERMGFPAWTSAFTGIQVWALSRVTRNYKNLARAIQAVKPHLLLTDIWHYGPDGIKVAQYVRTQINPEIALVIVSASGHQKNIPLAFEAGIRDFIIKPFEIEEYSQRIFGLLDKLGYGRLSNIWD